MSSELDRCPARGFRLAWRREIPYLSMRMAMFRHESGLQVLSLDCPDLENCFIAGFRTPGYDNKGVQHVLEHVVLGGSRNFQVKGPCDELSRGSLATYINAETYLDRTLYPYASLNEAEFHNGLTVYLDGVFNPLLRRETFMQEGWRYEFVKDKAGRETLRTTGIVLNERRAQLNDMSDVALNAAYTYLLPGHCLSFDSGGLPGTIENLDYDTFLAYYAKHYALPKARLFFYGSIPTERKLQWLADYLDAHCHWIPAEQLHHEDDQVPPVTETWRQPRTVTIPIAVDEEDGWGWTLNWHLGQLLDSDERLGMELLYLLLLEDDSSPLRKCLQESGLCEDVMDCSGLETEHGECLFIVGAVNCGADGLDALRELCLECLRKLAEKDFPKEHVQAAFNQLSLRYMEYPNGYGLQVGRQIMRNWLSGQEPLAGVDYRKSLAGLRGRLQKEPDFMVTLLRRYLLDNQHRVELRLQPDCSLQERRQQAERERWQKVHDSMTVEQRRALEQDLKRWYDDQHTGDSPEALEAFPHLLRSELPDKPYDPPVERRICANGTVLLRGLVPSPGINYVKVGYEAGLFAPEELNVLPVFSCLLDAVGCAGEDYGAFEQRLAAAGAELDADVQLESVGTEVRSLLTLKLGGLEESWTQGLHCLCDKVRNSEFDDLGHMREILRQCWAQAGQKLGSDDDSLDYVLGRSGAGVAMRETLYEGWYGIEGVRRLRESQRRMRGSEPELPAILSRMGERLRESPPHMVAYVGADEGFEQVRQWAESLPSQTRPLAPMSWLPREVMPELGRKEWLPVARHGCSCVRSFRACTYDNPLWAGMCVYCELLSEGYLQEAIRLTGGAYGGGCSYYPASGLVQMYSYSDPQPLKTLKAFDGALGRVEPWSERQVTGAIVGCVRGDVPLHAGESCGAVLTRELIGLSNEARALRRQRLLAVTLKEVRQAAEALKAFAEQGWNDCVSADRSHGLAGKFVPVSWGK